MDISSNNPFAERKTRNIFIILELTGDLFNYTSIQVVSNRQLVMRWINDSGKVFMKRKGKPPKALDTYAKLCKAFEKSNSIPVIVLGDEDPARYELLKCPVISK